MAKPNTNILRIISARYDSKLKLASRFESCWEGNLRSKVLVDPRTNVVARPSPLGQLQYLPDHVFQRVLQFCSGIHKFIRHMIMCIHIYRQPRPRPTYNVLNWPKCG